MPQKKARLDTHLESEGAEFLVLGQLLISKIAAYKAYSRMRGYDLIAFDPKANVSAKISVKSRWSSKAYSILIKKKTDCDFVVVVKLNRGSKDGRLKGPEFFVIPIAVLNESPRIGKWNKVQFKRIPKFGSFKDAWPQIEDLLRSRAHKAKA
ncbi:MAG: hypothetical protein ACYDDI_17335 [Candidatus Acidiferrales bacterium]